MKRTNESDELLLDAQPSCKKMRISHSAGELRLDRDLGALNWPRPYQNFWCAGENLALERKGPLELILTVHNTRVYIQLDRMYPHVPPVVVHVENGPRIMVSSAPGCAAPGNDVAMQCQDNDNTIHYNLWTPIQGIGDMLDFVVRKLTLPQQQTELMDQQYRMPAKHCLFAPNRFNMGYDRSVPLRAMEC